MNRLTAATFLFCAILGSACSPAETTATHGALTESNSHVLNGFSLNGFSLNGFSLNGFSLNGTVLNGFSLNGTALSGISVSDSRFVASQGGTVLSGAELAGAVLDITVTPQASPTPVAYSLRLDSITLAAGTEDVYLHAVSYRPSGSAVWQSACVDAAGNPVAAVVLSNSWDAATGARIDDASTFTFACVNAALGKCALWGYRPWATATHCTGSQCATVALTDYHQACTRMVRADYCGSGVPYTVNGTLIDIFDDLAPPIAARGGTWGIEARWTPSGASCMSGARVEELITQGKSPDCNHNGDKGKDDFVDCNKNEVPWLLTSACAGCSKK